MTHAGAASRYTHADAVSTLWAIGAWWEQLQRSRTVPVGFEDLLAAQSTAFTQTLGRPPTDGSLETIEELAKAAENWARKGGDPYPLLTASLDLIDQAGRLLRAAGVLPATDRGLVDQLNVSGGGVPKLPVDELVVGAAGIEGDKQNNRVHHGRPWQDVCIWSAEVIDAFAAEGHPLAYGSAGENITVRGIPWGQVQAGARLQVGEALLETTLWSVPCSKNAAWFIGRDFNLMHDRHGPISRIYATVVRPGCIKPGDDVILEP